MSAAPPALMMKGRGESGPDIIEPLMQTANLALLIGKG